jgi:uncharacterized protein (DUF952 family)
MAAAVERARTVVTGPWGGVYAGAMARILHLTRGAEWRAARAAGEYRGSTRDRSLDEVGFIHCSRLHQVTRVANAVYPGEHGLVLLVIDTDRVAAEIRDEAGPGSDERFPHIYGPLNLDAVVDVIPIAPRADGTFELDE